MNEELEKVIDDKLNNISDSIEDLYVPIGDNITKMVNEQNKVIENDRKYELINELISLSNLDINISRDAIDNSIFEDMSIEELENKIKELKSDK